MAEVGAAALPVLRGPMELDGETYPAQPGDVFVNEPYGTHGLRNTGGEDLAVLVLESPCPAGKA